MPARREWRGRRRRAPVVRARPLAVAVMVAAGLLSACGNDGALPAPGEKSEGEARALEAAASMLDEQRLPERNAMPGATPSPLARQPDGDEGATGQDGQTH